MFAYQQVIQLVTAVMYCLLESLAASLNPQNDHWRLRDEAAYILARISRYCKVWLCLHTVNTVTYFNWVCLENLKAGKDLYMYSVPSVFACIADLLMLDLELAEC